MKDNKDQSTVDFLHDLDADEKLYNEYSIAVNVISKAMLKGLSKTDLRIVHRIIVDAKYEAYNDFPINQTKLADSIFMQQPNIARSIKKLLAAQMLKKLDNGNYQLLITKSYQY